MYGTNDTYKKEMKMYIACDVLFFSSQFPDLVHQNIPNLIHPTISTSQGSHARPSRSYSCNHSSANTILNIYHPHPSLTSATHTRQAPARYRSVCTHRTESAGSACSRSSPRRCPRGARARSSARGRCSSRRRRPQVRTSCRWLGGGRLEWNKRLLVCV
jgi:hypothetical protein